jgi:hypothetical protein
MRRISLLILGLCTLAWATGCCHSYYSRYHDWDDSCSNGQDRCRGRHHHRRSDRTARTDRGDSYDDFDNGCGDCCDSCCDCCAGNSGQPAAPSQPSSYDGSTGMTGGGCASGNCAQGAIMNGTPMSGGCASGNCGSSTPTYGGMPFDPADGWTIQSTTTHPVGNEPVPAPAASGGTPVTPANRAAQGWVPSSGSTSSAPTPAPVPPPVSYNR